MTTYRETKTSENIGYEEIFQPKSRQALYALLAAKYPHGTAGLETLPEENEPDFWGQMSRS